MNPRSASGAQAAHVPDGLRDNLRVMYEDYDQYGFPGGNALVLRAILGREPRSLQQYIQELASRKKNFIMASQSKLLEFITMSVKMLFKF
jgi:hypothetical protein